MAAPIAITNDMTVEQVKAIVEQAYEGYPYEKDNTTFDQMFQGWVNYLTGMSATLKGTITSENAHIEAGRTLLSFIEDAE